MNEERDTSLKNLEIDVEDLKKSLKHDNEPPKEPKQKRSRKSPRGLSVGCFEFKLSSRIVQ